MLILGRSSTHEFLTLRIFAASRVKQPARVDMEKLSTGKPVEFVAPLKGGADQGTGRLSAAEDLVQIPLRLSLARESLEFTEQSLQETYAPNGVCFGCGPANSHGLHVRSYVADGVVVADWKPERYHEAFEGYVNGGIIGVLFDCHSNWAATYSLMKRKGLSTPPGTVTAEYSVTHLSPTPITSTLHLISKIVDLSDNKAVVETTLEAAGKVTARFKGTFVAVREGHPAYGRWR